MGVRYGTIVEDFFTGYRLQCEGWRSFLCNPERAAFYGDVPITLIDVLNQTKRWFIGFLEVAFSKYCPLTFGSRSMGLLMGLSYAHYSLWAIWSIPGAIYAFLPQLALINGVTIFPKVMYSNHFQALCDSQVVIYGKAFVFGSPSFHYETTQIFDRYVYLVWPCEKNKNKKPHNIRWGET